VKKFVRRILIGVVILLVLCFLVLAAFDAANYNREGERLQEQKDEVGQLFEDYGNKELPASRCSRRDRDSGTPNAICCLSARPYHINAS
jgi:hypothetical protein